MCGRYQSNNEDEMLEIIRINSLLYDELMLNEMKYDKEIYPSNVVPIITQDRKLVLSKWGFDKWDGKGIIINARSETLASSRFFSPHLKEGRCIIPAKGYFEWLKQANGPSIKYMFNSTELNYMYLAGLVKRINDKESTFTIITKEANPDINFIHDRMPLIFDQEKMEKWLFAPLDTSMLNEESIKVEYQNAL